MGKRVFLIVLDSLGIGALPDAPAYGDAGSNTLKSVSGSSCFKVPTLERLGLFHIDGIQYRDNESPSFEGVIARMEEASKGKDTTIGHWEIAGIVSPEPMPLFPEGFPPELIARFEEKTGRKVLCNKPYSGTAVIEEYGKKHMETGDLIVYTSADSVFQIAAHEDIIPIEEQYRICEMAREILSGPWAVGRVIARPFKGVWPNFERTSNRHDFSLPPPRPTFLDHMMGANLDTISIGKIVDIFAGKGISDAIRTKDNSDGMNKTLEVAGRDFTGICFVNLVDFDMKYGHRNDIDGYAEALAVFDRQLSQLLPLLNPEDLLIITADHGCDPGFGGTDHSREYTPMIAWGETVSKGLNLGTRKTFADISKTILDYFGIGAATDGESFWKLMQKPETRKESRK